MTAFDPRSRVRLMAEYRVGLALRPPQAFAVCSVDNTPPSEILAELRESNPHAAAILDELVVLDDAGRCTPESLEALTAAVQRGTLA